MAVPLVRTCCVRWAGTASLCIERAVPCGESVDECVEPVSVADSVQWLCRIADNCDYNTLVHGVTCRDDLGG